MILRGVPIAEVTDSRTIRFFCIAAINLLTGVNGAAYTAHHNMEGTLRGVIGLGVTLFVLAAGMGVVNGLARGWAASTLQGNPNSNLAKAVLMLY